MSISGSYWELQAERISKVDRSVSLLVSLVTGPRDLQRKGPGSAVIFGSFFSFLLLKSFMYLSLEREEGKAKERETLIVCLLHTPNQGAGPQSRHVP